MEKFKKVYEKALRLLEGMDCASVVGTTPHTAGSDYGIDYAPNDARVPKVIGAKRGKAKKKKYPFIQRRNLNYA